jgi:probable HAF family extracellular repeat protein
MRNTLVGLGAAALFVTAAPSLAGGGSLNLLDSGLATDVTIDDLGITHVLGSEITGNGAVTIYESFAGSDFFGTYVGDGIGWSISADGSAFAGSFTNLDGDEEAARWTDSGGWEGLGQLPTGLACPSISNGWGISADGETVVGLAWDGCNGRAFIWTSATEMEALDVAGSGGNRANAISADASTISGFGQASNRSPTIWNAADGSVEYFDEETVGEGWGMTPDGSTVVGSSNGPAVYWNDCEGMVPIGMLSGDPSAEANDISADGTVIVGTSGTLMGGRRAFVWTQHTGIISLQQLLLDNGVVIPDGVIVEAALAISADGSTVVGRSFDPAYPGLFGLRGYVATLPDLGPGCPADFDWDGAVGFTDLTALLGVWGPCACPNCPEDLDGDGSVGFTDLTALLGVWGPCTQE